MENLPRTKSGQPKYLAQRALEGKIGLAVILFLCLLVWSSRLFGANVPTLKPTPKIKISSLKVEREVGRDYPYLIFLKTMDSGK